jgi:hypothetical protein
MGRWGDGGAARHIRHGLMSDVSLMQRAAPPQRQCANRRSPVTGDGGRQAPGASERVCMCAGVPNDVRRISASVVPRHATIPSSPPRRPPTPQSAVIRPSLVPTDTTHYKPLQIPVPSYL